MSICELCNTKIQGEHDKDCAFENWTGSKIREKALENEAKQNKIYNELIAKFNDDQKKIWQRVFNYV
jgi:hypothetical protein